MLTLSVVATKGGVGKTTLCANIGGLLADMGYRVLLIDADIQPALTRHFQLSHVAEHGLTTMLQRGALADDCISHVSLPPETFRGDISVLNVRGGFLHLVRSDTQTWMKSAGYSSTTALFKTGLRTDWTAWSEFGWPSKTTLFRPNMTL
ncbi:ParA-like protein [Hydrogenophaga sp. T4]|nr:ParA-like protein [Hydrogenophaga sp. T4]